MAMVACLLYAGNGAVDGVMFGGDAAGMAIGPGLCSLGLKRVLKEPLKPYRSTSKGMITRSTAREDPNTTAIAEMIEGLNKLKEDWKDKTGKLKEDRDRQTISVSRHRIHLWGGESSGFESIYADIAC